MENGKEWDGIPGMKSRIIKIYTFSADRVHPFFYFAKVSNTIAHSNLLPSLTTGNSKVVNNSPSNAVTKLKICNKTVERISRYHCVCPALPQMLHTSRLPSYIFLTSLLQESYPRDTARLSWARSLAPRRANRRAGMDYTSRTCGVQLVASACS